MKINITSRGCVPQEQMFRNLDICKSRGYPQVQKQDRPPLAVVGGGHSVRSYVDELWAWKGDIWASGSVFQWLKGLGIDCTLFCVDPHPLLAEMAVGAKRAILASTCDPSAFDVLKDAEVQVFDLVRDGVGVNHGPTSVTTSFDLAITHMGYTSMTFYGCDSSYSDEPASEKPHEFKVRFDTHAYKCEEQQMLMRVVCNGRAYLTCAEFFLQAKWMAEMFRSKVGESGVIVNKSGGLLAAMIQDPDYDCTHVSEYMAKHLEYKEAA